MKRPIVVARAVLLREDGHVLMGLRRETGRWEFPGGKVDNETVMGATIREVYEETGLVVNNGARFLGYADAVNLVKTKRSVDLFHLFSSWEGEPQVLEDSHSEWRWFPLSSPPPAPELMPSTAYCFAHFLPEYV